MDDLEARDDATVHVMQPDVVVDISHSSEVIADLKAKALAHVEKVKPVVSVDMDIDQLDTDKIPVNQRGAGWARYRESKDKRRRALEMAANGSGVNETCEAIGITNQTWYGWKKRYPDWAAKHDILRQNVKMARTDVISDADLMHPAAFAAHYFGMPPAWFQLMFMNEMETMPKGNITLILFPPGHAKTTTFENHANRKLALSPAHRFLVASEQQGIAKKILGRVMDRMNPLGPTPGYVKDFGPFMPEGRQGARQPWTDEKFNVYRARLSDERNFSMEAVGARGSVVSARTDHAHVDDIQSTKTMNLTDKIANWFRQDLLSRPGEEGITTVAGTRVGDGDFYETLLEDPDLGDVMKVIKFPAIITDPHTGEQTPLWEGVHTLDSLDRIRRKVGQDIWDRNWMQSPGASRSGKGTFTRDVVDDCKDADYSLEHLPGHNIHSAHEPVVIIGLDPALGGHNVITAVEATPDGKLIPRRIRDDVGFERNEQIMGALESVVRWCNTTGMVTNVIIEDKNFQLGLKNDERLKDMSKKYGFTISGHMTGWNKYDPDIGVASMVTAFIRKEIILPWAEDDQTRHLIGEFCRQLFAWKPGVKGSRLRQDQVMAFWFVWMWWRARRKNVDTASTRSATDHGFKRQTGGYQMTEMGLYTPMGVR